MTPSPPGYLRSPIIRSTGHFFSSSLTSDPEGPTPRDKSGSLLQFQFEFSPGRSNTARQVRASSSVPFRFLTRKIRHFVKFLSSRSRCQVPVVKFPLSSSRHQKCSTLRLFPVRVREFTSCSSTGLSVAPAISSSRFPCFSLKIVQISLLIKSEESSIIN